MWNKLILISYLAVVCCFLSHVHSQSTDSPEFFQNLTCITHDLENMSCSWDTPGIAASEIVYEVCSGSEKRCFETKRNKLEVEFHVFGVTDVKIKAKSVLGTPEKHFEMGMDNIPYVPHTPQILSLVADYHADILYVEWTVDSSSFLKGVDVKWEINVLRGENLQLVLNETFVEQWNSSENVFHWNWTSDFPLNCTSHSVRIQCYVYEKYYYGEIRPSEWSATKTVRGSKDEDVMFPEDAVVHIGSNMTFCCIVAKGKRITSIEFSNKSYPLIELGSSSSGIRLVNMNKSVASGDNFLCYAEYEFAVGNVVFVGYPPDKPQDFNCEARDLRIINCTWKAGRATELTGNPRGTKYTLYERLSGINVSCNAQYETKDEYYCSYDVRQGQNLHDFLLIATNFLGTSNTSVAINVTERIHPLPLDRLGVYDISPAKVSISWLLHGKYTSVNLSCEIEIKKIHGETEKRYTTVNGLEDFYYGYDIDNLHPFHVYDFRVRCSSHDHFWKWSDWSNRKRHTTLTAAPSRKLDIWRETMWSPEGRVIIVYWKHLTLKEAKGLVTSYDVAWKPLKSDGEYQHLQLSADLNKTHINLTGSDDKDYEISVTAINSAGSSPPSRITTVQLPSAGLEVERAVGEGTGINISWTPDANVTCGYVVIWIPSSHSPDSDMLWKRFPSNAMSVFITSQQFQAGIRYNVSLYGCKDYKYQVLKRMFGYTEELTPKVAPNFTVQETTANSILVKWEPVLDDDLCGFLLGYLIYVVKHQNNSSLARFQDLVGHAETKIKNITDPAVRMLKIEDLQSGTSYLLGLQAYTGGGKGPIKSFSVATNDNAVGLILAILIPIAVAVLLGIVTSTICYQKREWIKETFYPDIPNPENSKALQFQKNVTEGNKTIKTLEMNPCTPNSVEVVETFYTVPKILDTELNSPMSEGGQLPEDDSEAQDDNHVVVSYCQPTAHEDTSNPMLDESATPSQVVYIDVQSMYQPQANSEEDPEGDFLDGAGYKPQMQLPISTVNMDNQAPAEDILDASSGYRPQGQPNTWALDSPGSPTSMGSENASFGSPCSTNSRHFLIPPVDNKDSLKPTHVGWSISSLFQNKQDD